MRLNLIETQLDSAFDHPQPLKENRDGNQCTIPTGQSVYTLVPKPCQDGNKIGDRSKAGQELAKIEALSLKCRSRASPSIVAQLEEAASVYYLI